MATKRQRIWGSDGESQPQLPVDPPAFDLLVAELHLSKEQYASSERLVRWVKANYMRKYVPETLLKELGLEVNVSFN